MSIIHISEKIDENAPAAEVQMSDETDERAILAKDDERVLTAFIEESRLFILRQAGATAGRFVTDSDDEWSIALSAFSEAVTSYDKEKGSFYSFASVVIKRRVLDYMRSGSRWKNELPADDGFMTGDAGEDEPPLVAEIRKNEQRRAEQEESDEAHASDVRSEIEELGELLSGYGFSFMDLSDCSPKAEKTKASTALVVKALLSSERLLSEMRRKKALPMKELVSESGVSKKIIDRHRRYIIAAAEILDGDFPGVAKYLHYIEEES